MSDNEVPTRLEITIDHVGAKSVFTFNAKCLCGATFKTNSFDDFKEWTEEHDDHTPAPEPTQFYIVDDIRSPDHKYPQEFYEWLYLKEIKRVEGRLVPLSSFGFEIQNNKNAVTIYGSAGAFYAKYVKWHKETGRK